MGWSEGAWCAHCARKSKRDPQYLGDMAFQPRGREGGRSWNRREEDRDPAASLILATLLCLRAMLILVSSQRCSPPESARRHKVRVVWRHYFHRNLSRGSAVMFFYLPFSSSRAARRHHAPRLIDDGSRSSRAADAIEQTCSRRRAVRSDDVSNSARGINVPDRAWFSIPQRGDRGRFGLPCSS